jgi:hypothetical protein
VKRAAQASVEVTASRKASILAKILAAAIGEAARAARRRTRMESAGHAGVEVAAGREASIRGKVLAATIREAAGANFFRARKWNAIRSGALPDAAAIQAALLGRDGAASVGLTTSADRRTGMQRACDAREKHAAGRDARSLNGVVLTSAVWEAARVGIRIRRPNRDERARRDQHRKRASEPIRSSRWNTHFVLLPRRRTGKEGTPAAIAKTFLV